MKRLLTLLLTKHLVHRTSYIVLLLCASLATLANPELSKSGRYHIVCRQFSQGCVTDGQTAGQPTPLYYLTQATTGDETYWTISEVNDGEYTIQNVKTGQYITYDGVREEISDNGLLRRYISMTDQPNDRLSLWTFIGQSEGVYAIRNVGQNDHIWDVRTDSYCVGTYSKTSGYNQNQLFSIFDEQGNLVVEEQEVTPVDPSGAYDVSSWLVATAESPDDWIVEGDAWTDPGFGNYRNGAASLVSPFLERWQESSWGPLPDGALYQTLTNLPTGDYTLQADIIAVRQSSGGGWWGGGQAEEVGKGVNLFANSAAVEAGTSNEKPQHYTVDFTVGLGGKVSVGISISNTNANWVAVDNFHIIFKGDYDKLLEGERAKVRAELTGIYTTAEIDQMIADCGDDFNKLEELRKSVANMPTPDPLSMALQGLTLGGHPLAYAESTDTYLCPIPLQHFGGDMEAKIEYTANDGWGNLRINGLETAPGSTYTFKDIEAGKTYTLRVYTSDRSENISKHVTFTSLPVVRIYGTFNNEYSEGTIVVTPTDEPLAETLNMKAKWRGGITNGNGKHKRNYHVKLKDAEGNKLERKFFGLRNDNSWILESCQVDMSRIRNRVLTDLWNDYSTPPYFKDKEKKARTGTRGQFVELILNDEYRGIYCMTENMDRKQMQLVKHDDENGIDHGQLWKSKDWSYAVFMGPNRGHYQPADYLTDPIENSEMWDKYQVKYPDFEDYGNQTDWSTLYNAVDMVCHSSDEYFKEHIAEYFDLPLLIDYYILMETILSTDNHGKNMFFAVYDKQVDKKITFGVWDMDATCGQRWSDQYYHWKGMQPEQDYATYIYNNEHGDYNLFKRLRDTDAEDFNQKVRLRYQQLRAGYLATESILQRFSNYLDEFKTCGAADREYEKWNYDSDIYNLPLDFDDEMEYLTDWFTRRMNYLDTQRFDIASLPPLTDISASPVTTDATRHTVYNLTGQRLSTQREAQLRKGVYIINGRKVSVK